MTFFRQINADLHTLDHLFFMKSELSDPISLTAPKQFATTVRKSTKNKADTPRITRGTVRRSRILGRFPVSTYLPTQLRESGDQPTINKQNTHQTKQTKIQNRRWAPMRRATKKSTDPPAGASDLRHTQYLIGVWCDGSFIQR